MIFFYVGGGILLGLLLLYLFLIFPAGKKEIHRHPLPGKLYAHRGLYDNVTIPENSLAAFRKAVEKGYGVELDIRLTKDQEIVVFHDDSLLRLCGIKAAVSALTLAEVKQARLLETEETIPTFAEVLSVLGGKVSLLVEYKTGLPGNKVNVLCEKAEVLLQKYQGKYVIESFDYEVLAWYRLHRPDIARGALGMGFHCWAKALGKAAEAIPLHRRKMISWLLYNYRGRPHFVNYRWQDIGFAVRLCRLLGIKVVCWTPNKKADGETLLTHWDAIVFEHFEI